MASSVHGYGHAIIPSRPSAYAGAAHEQEGFWLQRVGTHAQ